MEENTEALKERIQELNISPYDAVMKRVSEREKNTRDAEWKKGPPPHIQPKEVEKKLLPIMYANRKQQRTEKYRKVNGRRVNRY